MNFSADEAADRAGSFQEIGPVELKSVPGAVKLHSAHRDA
jgi:hypothetical protein